MSTSISYTYTESTNYTFSSTSLLEISSGVVILTDLRTTNATFFASYTSSINGNWGGGTLTGTATGGASVSSGYLNLSYDDIRYIDYNAISNADMQQIGCIRYRTVSNYSSISTNVRIFFDICKGTGDTTNRLMLQHNNIGQLLLNIKDQANIDIMSVVLGNWYPSSGSIYEFELNFDITNGNTFLLIDGAQFGSLSTSTGTRSTDINLFRIGSDCSATKNSNMDVNDIILFNTVQHTTDYTPTDWSEISETKYSTSNPSITTITEFKTLGLESFTATVYTTGNDTIQHILNQESTALYITGGVWTTASSTYSQSNTSSDIDTYSTSYISDSLIKDNTITSFLHSENGNTTPELDQIDLTFLNAYPSMNSHTYFGYLKQLDNTNLENKTIQVRIEYLQGDKSLINNDYITTTVNSSGYWEISIYYEDEQPNRLYWYIDSKKYITNFSTEVTKFSGLRILRG